MTNHQEKLTRVQELIDNTDALMADLQQQKNKLNKALALGRIWSGLWDDTNGDPKVKSRWTTKGKDHRGHATNVQFTITRTDDAGSEDRVFEVHEVPGILQDGRP